MNHRALLVVTLCLVGCSRVTVSEEGRRALGSLELDGKLRVSVSAMHELTKESAGLAEKGRWFDYQQASQSRRVSVLLRASLLRGGTLDRTLRTEACGTEAECKAKLDGVEVRLCESHGDAIVIFDGSRWALSSFAGQIYDQKIPDDGARCEDTAQRLPSLVERVIASPSTSGCRVLLEAKQARPATRCMFNLGLSSSLAAPSYATLIEAAIAGEPGSGQDAAQATVQATDLTVQWVAAVARGQAQGPELDFEAALYDELLDPSDRTMHAAVRLALAYAPSRARRVRYLEQALARCEAKTLTRSAQIFAGFAAGLLADKPLGERVARVCDVAIPAPEPWHPSHLKTP